MTMAADAGLPIDSGSTDLPAPAAELAGRVARLRQDATGGRYDRWMLVVGGLLLPLGVLLVVIGWLGTAHTVLLFEQIPYIVSGGLLGLALVVVGGFVYFGYWQTLLVREGRDQHRDLVASLGRIEALLAGQQSQPPAAGAGGTSRGGAPVASPALVATPNGTMLHRPDCSVVAGRTDLRRVAVGAPGFEACRICQPFD
jgi:hypothetical protein